MRSIAGTYPATTTVVVTTGNNQQSYTSSITVVRPANTTAYTAGDVVGATAAAIEFTNCGSAESHILITDLDIRIDVSAIPSGMTNFRVHLYAATPASALADNAVWDLPSGDRTAYLGYIDTENVIDLGSTLIAVATGVNKLVKLGAASSLWAYVVTNAAFTPTSEASKTFRINTMRV